MDFIGPWTVNVGTGSRYEFTALICTYRVTYLADLICVDNKTTMHMAAKFDECRLSRVPWPKNCCRDNGGEFMDWEFQ